MNKEEKCKIPKIIHYCWFGGNSLPDWAIGCIETWKKYCPDYKIIQWDESNYDISKNNYMQEAYSLKKWGFVPDYARLDIIYHYGGIYLDTDVEIVKSLDSLLYEKGFAGFESEQYVALGLGFGAEKGNIIIKEMMNRYKELHFINKDGTLNDLPSPAYSSEILEKNGFIMDGSLQKKENFSIFPKDYFCPQNYETGEFVLTNNTFSIHHYSSTWLSRLDKIVREIEKCKNKKGLEYRLRRFLSFPFRILNKINKLGFFKTVKFVKEKLVMKD